MKSTTGRTMAASFCDRVIPALHVSPTDFGEPCTHGDNQYNGQVLAYIRRLRALVQVANQEVAKLESGSKDLRPLVSAITQHDNELHWFMFVGCSPSGDIVELHLERHDREVEAVCQRAIPVVDRLFAAFQVAVDDLTKAATDIATLRLTFGSSESPPVDIEHQFTAGTADLDAKGGACGTFNMVAIGIKASLWDPARLLQAITDAMALGQTSGDITDLDRLRFEYAERRIRCPLPSVFSQGKSSLYFSHSELNKGDYTWSILPEAMLEILDRLHEAMTDLGYAVQLNSMYRSPKKNQTIGGGAGSQHQYGRAADFQTFDLDASGGVDVGDWGLLRDVVVTENPTWVEPVSQSGVGHVHAQWQGIAVLEFEDSSEAELSC